jgi:flagellar hook protein FlgE
MSSGAVSPQFSKDITIYDSLGNSHNIALNVAKVGTNKWAVELTAVPASDILPANSDGQIAAGIVTFNGDGTYQFTQPDGGETSNSISAAAVTSDTQAANSPLQISWANGANPSSIALNLGTSGESNGLIQTASAFNVSVANQNGSAVGELTGVSIDTSGFVIASYSNGQSQKVYQVPLASVDNPDGLKAVTGDAYTQTLASGIANLNLAGTNGVGTFSPSTVEESNVDLSTQLTDLIVAQQAYGANSKVLTIADQLLQELDQIIQ